MDKEDTYYNGGIVSGENKANLSNDFVVPKDHDYFNSLFNVNPNEEVMKLLKDEVVVNPNTPLPQFNNLVKSGKLKKLLSNSEEIKFTESNVIPIKLKFENRNDNKGEDE